MGKDNRQLKIGEAGATNTFDMRIFGRAGTLGSMDLLICSGNMKASKLIQRYNRLMGVKGLAAEMTHVAGIVEWCTQAIKTGDDGLLHYSGPAKPFDARGYAVFEATTLNKWAKKSGFQVNPFDAWLRNYDGRVWLRRMQPWYWDDAAVWQAVQKLIGMPYESGIPGLLELALCGVEWEWFRKRFDTKNKLRTVKLHCTESFVNVSKMLRMCLASAAANKMPPYEFWPGGQFERSLCGFLLGEPIRIK